MTSLGATCTPLSLVQRQLYQIHVFLLRDGGTVFCALEYRMAKLYALRRLSAQSLPSTTLARALRQRLVTEETIERLNEELKQQGYLNDEEWTASYVRGQIARKRGPKAIVQKLAHKGISEEQAHSALESASGADQQKQAIAKLIQTRYASRNLSDFKERQKVIASLARRGFDLSIILIVFLN